MLNYNNQIISAQQLPRRKNSVGREIFDNNILDPYVEVSIHAPDWLKAPLVPESPTTFSTPSSTTTQASSSAATPTTSSSNQTSSTSTRVTTLRTAVVKNNGFNPVWEEKMSLQFDCVADLLDLVFVRFAVKDEHGESLEPLAVYCMPLGSLQQGTCLVLPS